MKFTVLFLASFLAFFLGWFGIGYNGPDKFKQRKTPDVIQQVVAAENSQNETDRLLDKAEQQIKSDYQDARFLSTKAEMLKLQQEDRRQNGRVGALIQDKPPDNLADNVTPKGKQ